MAANILLVGVSGVSSSGKTTLARLLRDVFKDSVIIHQDDFYYTDEEIPVKNGVQDWDCVEAIDQQALCEALQHLRQTGSLPSNLNSKEDQNSVGHIDVDTKAIEQWRQRASELAQRRPIPKIALVDGFLLYADNISRVRELLDVRLLLRADFKTLKARREARTGYVTLEGFWEDPPGYIEDVVWPNYVKDHAFLFVNGDVEGQPDTDTLASLSVHCVPAHAQRNMTECLNWACSLLFNVLENAKAVDSA